MQSNQVYAAFEILLEEIEQVVNGLHAEGAEAFLKGNYEVVRLRIEKATRLSEFRDKIKALQKEWELSWAKPASRSGKALLREKVAWGEACAPPKRPFGDLSWKRS